MDDQRVGAAIRRVRLRARRTQASVARAAGVSQSTVSRVERGHLGRLQLQTIRAIAAALEIRLDLTPRWRGADLDRMLGAAHAAMHASIAGMFAGHRDWAFRPEVSFSIWGERGIVDILAWHAKRKVLLVIELKTEIVDLNELLGTLDRKVRLGPEIARMQGWPVPAGARASAWVIVSEGRTNRRRIQAHAAMVRAALPDDGRAVAGWLERPRRTLRCLSYLASHAPPASRARMSRGDRPGPEARPARR